jgi:hypothetical protein
MTASAVFFFMMNLWLAVSIYKAPSRPYVLLDFIVAVAAVLVSFIVLLVTL